MKYSFLFPWQLAVRILTVLAVVAGVGLQAALGEEGNGKLLPFEGMGNFGYGEDVTIAAAVEDFNVRFAKLRDPRRFTPLTEAEVIGALKVLLEESRPLTKKDRVKLATLCNQGKLPKGSLLSMKTGFAVEDEGGKDVYWSVGADYVVLQINFAAATGGNINPDKVRSVIIRVKFFEAVSRPGK